MPRRKINSDGSEVKEHVQRSINFPIDVYRSVDTRTLQTLLRHTEPSMTLKYYTLTRDDVQRRALAHVGRLLGDSPASPGDVSAEE